MQTLRVFAAYGRRTAACALVGLAAAGAAGTAVLEPLSAPPVEVTEPVTGTAFATRRPEAKEEVLVGTAVRCMLGQCTWAKARAYAVGLYVQDSPFLASFQASEERARAEEDAGAGARGLILNADGVTRRLVLVMNQDVRGPHIAHGFDKSLLARVRKAQGNTKKGTGKDALKKFTAQFASRASLPKGTAVEFVITDNLVVTLMDGVVTSAIESQALSKAVLGTFLDEKSIFAKYKNTSFAFL